MKIVFGDCWSPENALVREIANLCFPEATRCGDYRFGTIYGLYKTDMSEAIEIVAINNSHPHNGHFALFMEELERLARKKKKPVRMMYFMNDRLYDKLCQRDGWHQCVFSDRCLEYTGK